MWNASAFGSFYLDLASAVIGKVKIVSWKYLNEFVVESFTLYTVVLELDDCDEDDTLLFSIDVLP